MPGIIALIILISFQLALPTEATIDAISEETAREKEIYRCLDPLKMGDCSNR